MRERVGELLEVRRTEGNGNYLGLPLMIGRNKRQIFSFMKDRILGEFGGGIKGFFLEQGGKFSSKVLSKPYLLMPWECFFFPKSL